MEVKVDTKEKFTTITPIVPDIHATMAEELLNICKGCLDKQPNSVILNLSPVTGLADEAAEAIAQLQQSFYDRNASFVICEIKPSVEEVFEKLELMDYLNLTPTESEAWDIVQMEEIERELMDSDDVEFNTNE
jgi:anti-anti-sigma regulatory factor